MGDYIRDYYRGCQGGFISFVTGCPAEAIQFEQLFFREGGGSGIITVGSSRQISQ